MAWLHICGESGHDRGADGVRLALQEVSHGRAQTEGVMQDLILVLGIVFWILLNRVILPRLGVQT